MLSLCVSGEPLGAKGSLFLMYGEPCPEAGSLPSARDATGSSTHPCLEGCWPEGEAGDTGSLTHKPAHVVTWQEREKYNLPQGA